MERLIVLRTYLKRSLEERRVRRGKVMNVKNTSMTLLLACILLSLSIYLHPISTAAEPEALGKGPRADTNILFYQDEFAAYTALKANYIDLMDSPLTANQYADAVADPNILLTPNKTAPKIGIKNYIHFKCIDVEDSILKGHNFSIQQNYFLKLCNGTVYWVQCGYDVFYTGTNCNLAVYVREWYEIWWVNVTHCSSQVKDIYGGVQYLGNYTNVGKPCTFTLEVNSYINGTKVIISGLQAPKNKVIFDWKNSALCGQIVTDPNDTLVQTNHLWEDRSTAPELVIVGYGGRSTAEWTPDTEGWVETYDATSLKGGAPDWVKDNSGRKLTNDKHTTGEKSHNMGWEWDPKTQRGKFKYKNCSDESGISYYIDSTRAYRKELPGVVDTHIYGINNEFTLLNAYRAENPSSPIRIGYPSTPFMLNVLYSTNYTERQILNQIHPHLIQINPYNFAIDMPWVAQDWEVGTWVDSRDGFTKTRITFWIRKDVGIVAPVTGDHVRYFNAHDVAFTIWYTHAFQDCCNWCNVEGVHHTKIVNDYTITVYFDDQLDLFLYDIGKLSLLPKYELLDPLCAQATDSWFQNGLDEYMLTYGVIQVVSANLDGVPLIEGVDYVIRAGYDVGIHNVFAPLHELTGTVSITYWYADIPATGFYLAGLPWEETMYSLGIDYPTAMEPYTGGYCVLHKNPYFFLETPLLGETDWRWTWEGTTKPRRGYYKIDILDVVKCTAAYCSRADGVVYPTWFPGADIDSYDLGHIGILDLVSITGKYAQTFGKPPP